MDGYRDAILKSFDNECIITNYSLPSYELIMTFPESYPMVNYECPL